MKIPTDGRIIDCEDAVRCIFNLKELDIMILRELRKHGSVRADELAKILHKERSTIYRSLQKLNRCGICEKKTKTIKQGGYYHTYSLYENIRIRETAEHCLEEWYRKVKKSLSELDKDN
jgi:predicted transcriptional regulator